MTISRWCAHEFLERIPYFTISSFQRQSHLKSFEPPHCEKPQEDRRTEKDLGCEVCPTKYEGRLREGEVEESYKSIVFHPFVEEVTVEEWNFCEVPELFIDGVASVIASLNFN